MYRGLKHYYLYALYLCLFFSSCNHKEEKKVSVPDQQSIENKKTLETGKVFSTVTSNGYYAAYIPPSYTGKEKFPVIIFLDPHGDGSFPISKYKFLAEKFGFLLIGSNESKNGIAYEQCKGILAKLVNDSTSNLPGLKEDITVAGFSGGAKAALVTGNTIKGIRRIIYCGAAFPPKNIEVQLPVLGFAGINDMNYTEIKDFNYSLNGGSIPHLFLEWHGKHEWPDSSTFLHSFYWIDFNLMKEKLTEINPKTIQDYKSIINKSSLHSSLINKALLYRAAINFMEPVTSTDSFKSELSKLEKSPSYIQEKRKQETTMFYEVKKKNEFAESFENKDLEWWKKQTDLLRADSNNQSNQRVLGYISLAAWSYSNSAVKSNNVPFAQKALEIYKLADPENSEQPFLMACLYAKNNVLDSAFFYLNAAVKLGLNEKNKVENEISFSTLRGRNEYQEIVSRLQ